MGSGQPSWVSHTWSQWPAPMPCYLLGGNDPQKQPVGEGSARESPKPNLQGYFLTFLDFHQVLLLVI